MKKYLVKIEFRYNDAPKFETSSIYKSKEVTVGVFDSFTDACTEGNRLMETLESKYPLHVFPNGRGKARRERFTETGGLFGQKKTLITNMAYLKTPFEFYAQIITLDHLNILETLAEVNEATTRYKLYKLTECD